MGKKTYEITNESVTNDSVVYNNNVDGGVQLGEINEKKIQENKEGPVKEKCDLKSSTGMQKTVGLVGGVSIIIGTMIGSGIFASPRSVAEKTGSVGLNLLVWCGSGLIGMMGALCYIELGTMIPKSGGEYAYFKFAYGDVVAFMFSYASSVVLKPASFAAISIACGDYIVEPFYGLEETKEKVIIAKCIGGLVIGNYNQ